MHTFVVYVWLKETMTVIRRVIVDAFTPEEAMTKVEVDEATEEKWVYEQNPRPSWMPKRWR